MSFLFQRADSISTFWNFYIVLSTAILGFLSAAKVEWLNNFLCFLLSLAFVLFAVGNLFAIIQVHGQWEALVKLVPTLEGYYNSLAPLVESAKPVERDTLIMFHLFLDITVVSFIWIIALIRRKHLETSV
jgi:hypothetical protein